MNGRIKRQEQSNPKIPIIGKIKVGMKNERGLPTSLDYFRCESKYSSYFHKAYGDTPNKIEVCFFSDDWSDSCNERYECRDKDGRLAGKGDGKNWYLYDSNEDKYILCHDKEKVKKSGKWDIILTINFIIPKIPGVFGLFSFSTKGKKSSLKNIRDTFDKVLEMAGTVINVPFDLTVDKVVSQKPGSKFKFPVVNLIPNVSSESMELIHKYIESGKSIKKIGLINEQKIKLLE